MTTAELIDQIQDVRYRNNKLWMDIVRTAMDLSPDGTKKLLKEIRENDLQVSNLMHKLTGGEDE